MLASLYSCVEKTAAFIATCIATFTSAINAAYCDLQSKNKTSGKFINLRRVAETLKGLTETNKTLGTTVPGTQKFSCF